jgi:hypothetical protein
MKRLAFLSSTIATLITPIQVQAQTNCVPFPQKPNPEAELRFLLSHTGRTDENFADYFDATCKRYHSSNECHDRSSVVHTQLHIIRTCWWW